MSLDKAEKALAPSPVISCARRADTSRHSRIGASRLLERALVAMRGSVEWMNLLNTSNGVSKNEDSTLFWRMSWSAAGRVKRSGVRTERNKFKLSPNHVDGSSLFSIPILG